MGNLRQVGQIRVQISHNKPGINNETSKNKLSSNIKKQSHHDMYATRHARYDGWTSHESSHLAEPVTLSLVTTEQAQATTIKNTILVEIQKLRGCVLFDALS
jgi:hypothetical protein